MTVVLGAIRKKLCPVATILQYMSNPRPAAASPRGALVVFSDGSALTRAKLVKEMRAALEARGIRPASDYAGHSYRGSHYGSNLWNARLPHKDTGKMGEHGLYPIHKDTS